MTVSFSDYSDDSAAIERQIAEEADLAPEEIALPKSPEVGPS